MIGLSNHYHILCSIVIFFYSIDREDLSIAETVSQVTEVRLTSSGGLGNTNHWQHWPSEKHYSYLETCWHQLYAALQKENTKLKVLEICSVSVRQDVVVAFSRCVMSGLNHLRSWTVLLARLIQMFYLHKTNQYLNIPLKLFHLEVQLIISSLCKSFFSFNNKAGEGEALWRGMENISGGDLSN